MKDRIRQVMENQHMSQKVFSQFIGMSEGSLSSIFTGRTKPTLNIIDAIHSKIPSISINWLLFGQGPMYSDAVKPSVSAQESASPGGIDMSLESGNLSSAPTLDFSEDEMPHSVNSTPSNRVKSGMKFTDKKPRRISEIRVFYDDNTWETFVPSK